MAGSGAWSERAGRLLQQFESFGGGEVGVVDELADSDSALCFFERNSLAPTPRSTFFGFMTKDQILQAFRRGRGSLLSLHLSPLTLGPWRVWPGCR